MARVSFNTIFKVHPNGSIESIRRVKISGVIISPGIRFSPGVRFGGIDLTLYVGKEIEIDDENGIIILKGIYR